MKGGDQLKLKRYIIELGTGIDLKGQDVTKAAVRAVRDAVGRSHLCGLIEIFGLSNLEDMHVKLEVAAPYTDQVRQEEILAAIPYGRKEINVTLGGMIACGLALPGEDPAQAQVLVVNVCLTVLVDLDTLVQLP